MSGKSLDELIAGAVSTAIDANIDRFTHLQFDRERYLSISDVASLSNVSKPTVRSWLTKSHQPLPSYKIGRDYRIKYRDFETWFEQYRTGP